MKDETLQLMDDGKMVVQFRKTGRKPSRWKAVLVSGAHIKPLRRKSPYLDDFSDEWIESYRRDQGLSLLGEER